MELHTAKRKALEMLSLGILQKDIAKSLKISDKTIGKWAKEWREKDRKTNLLIDKLKDLLDKLIDDKEASKYEILLTSASIKELDETLLLKPKVIFIKNGKKRSSTV
jgi:predicted transcriptional regulator